MMTDLLKKPCPRTQPTSDRKDRACRAALRSLDRNAVILRVPMRGVDAAVYSCDLRTGSYLCTTGMPGTDEIDMPVYGEGEPVPDGLMGADLHRVEIDQVGHVQLWTAADSVKTDPLPDEVANFYISFFEALQPQPEPEPVLQSEETVDWEFMVRAARSSHSGRIKVRLRNKGPARPRRDDTPWD